MKRIEANMKTYLVVEHITTQWTTRTVTALIAELPDRMEQILTEKNPLLFKTSLLKHPMLLRGSIRDGVYPDYDIQCIGYKLGAEEVKKEEL